MGRIRVSKFDQQIGALAQRYVQAALARAVKKAKILEPDKLPVRKPSVAQIKKPHYKWTEEKRAYLIELLKDHFVFGCNKLADAMNKRFPEGVRANQWIISFEINNETSSRLSFDYSEVNLQNLVEALKNYHKGTFTQTPEDYFISIELASLIKAGLGHLNPAQKIVVLKCFGFNGQEQTLEEIGKDANTGQKQVIQVLNKALRKLRRFIYYYYIA